MVYARFLPSQDGLPAHLLGELMKIAVIGSGIAGLSAAWALSQKYQVSLFEAENRLGGHSNTHTLPDGYGNMLPVDTGFIVYNTHNYPNLVKFFEATGVATEESDMSFAVSIGRGKTEYFGDAKGMFAQRRNTFRPSHWLMVRDILRFYKQAPAQLDLVREKRLSLGELLDLGRYSRAFRYRHILPMAAAIWSTPVEKVKDFPAEAFISFFMNHRLFDLDLLARPVWRTVTGGSREYVRKVADLLGSNVHAGRPVLSARPEPEGLRLTIGSPARSEAMFDQVVFACHPDQALTILEPHATAAQRAVLGAIRYSSNIAVLHTDEKLMPRRKRAWASWNYLAEREAHSDETLSPVALTYWMNRLQNLDTKEPALVTLNPVTMPAEDKTHAVISYDHPLFNRDALEAQHRLGHIQGQGCAWFCGAWCGYGFHEDGASSGFAVASALGAAAPWAHEIEEMSPAGANATPAVPLKGASLAAE